MRHFRLAVLLLTVAVLLTCAAAQTASSSPAPGGSDAFITAQNYLIVFYPRWFTYKLAGPPAPWNAWFGPDHMGPIFGAVVAPNDDTLYVSSFMNVESQPVIVTIPETSVTFSLLPMDVYGNVYSTRVLPPNALGRIQPGTYGLTGPGWQGTLPPGITPVPLPFNWSIWLIRADKYSKTGQDQTIKAEEFRRSLRVATLSEYLQNPQAGLANIVPVIFYAPKYKVIADDLIASDPITFLTELQASVHDSTTPPLSAYEQQLSDHFDALLADPQNDSELGAGAQAGHQAILDRYVLNTGSTDWITFTNIGAWGNDYLARSATTEYLDLSNTRTTAAYYHAFKDINGNFLDTNTSPEYVLNIPADQIPQSRRFWSLTMYTPDSILFVANDLNKYVVAGYTPGLVYNQDGSLSIYMSVTQPPGVPQANWLPAPQGAFDVVLRVYGPEGSVANNTYVPPAIQPVQ